EVEGEVDAGFAGFAADACGAGHEGLASGKRYEGAIMVFRPARPGTRPWPYERGGAAGPGAGAAPPPSPPRASPRHSPTAPRGRGWGGGGGGGVPVARAQGHGPGRTGGAGQPGRAPAGRGGEDPPLPPA